MTTITLPPEIEEPLTKAAQEQGTTLELLAIDCLRQRFTPSPTEEKASENETLFDFLSGYVGTVDGPAEALSENCGQRFTQGLLEKQRRGHL